MDERRCRYCQKNFQPSKFQSRHTVCSEPNCQRRRRTDYHRQKIASDPEYREVCRDSPRKWRARNPDYWKRYRQEHPTATEKNRRQQRVRDRKRRLCHLANNTSALDLKHSAAEVWLVGPDAAALVKNNVAFSEVMVFQRVIPLVPEFCKEHRSGSSDALRV